jgi:hypothetical protein
VGFVPSVVSEASRAMPDVGFVRVATSVAMDY